MFSPCFIFRGAWHSWLQQHFLGFKHFQGRQLVPKSGRSERAGQGISGFIRQLLPRTYFLKVIFALNRGFLPWIFGAGLKRGSAYALVDLVSLAPLSILNLESNPTFPIPNKKFLFTHSMCSGLLQQRRYRHSLKFMKLLKKVLWLLRKTRNLCWFLATEKLARRLTKYIHHVCEMGVHIINYLLSSQRNAGL